MRLLDFRGRSCRRRSGFTLLELLVIVTIIAALLALTASAFLKMIVVQQTNNTQTTETKVQSLINRQWSAVKDQAKKETIPPQVDAYIRQTLVGSSSDANVNSRVRVVYVKLKMRQMFPMNFAEALNLSYNNPQLSQLGIPTSVQSSPLLAPRAYEAYLNKLGINQNTLPYLSATPTGGNGTYAPQSYESAACLLMALQVAQSGGGANAGDIGGGGSSINFTIFNSQNSGVPIPLPLFVDAWQQPLYFTRVPAGCSLINPNPTVPGGGVQGIHDPGDTEGALNSSAWLQPNSQNQSSTTLFSQLTLQPLAAGNSSYNLMPMIASSGQNRKLEVDPLWFSGSYSDDLFSNP